MLGISLSLNSLHKPKYKQRRYIVDNELFTAQVIWMVIGIVSVLYFLWAEFMIGAICPLCTIVHVVIFSQAMLVYRTVGFRKRVNPAAKLSSNIARVIRVARYWIAVAVILFAIAFVTCNVLVDVKQPGWVLMDQNIETIPSETVAMNINTAEG